MTVATRLKWQEASGERFKPPKANSKHFAQAMNDASEGLSAHITGVKFQCACLHILSTLSSKTPLQCHKITEMSSYLNLNMLLLFYNRIDVPSGMMLCRFCTCGTSGNILIKYGIDPTGANLSGMSQTPCLASVSIYIYIYIILHGHVTHLYKQMYASTAM